MLFTASLGAAMMIMCPRSSSARAMPLDTSDRPGDPRADGRGAGSVRRRLAPIMVSTSAFGLYGLVVTLVWGRLRLLGSR